MPRATRCWYALVRNRCDSCGFVMNPVSTRIAGTFAQLNPVRSERWITPRSTAPVERTTAFCTAVSPAAVLNLHHVRAGADRLRLTPDRRRRSVPRVQADQRRERRDHERRSARYFSAIG